MNKNTVYIYTEIYRSIITKKKTNMIKTNEKQNKNSVCNIS